MSAYETVRRELGGEPAAWLVTGVAGVIGSFAALVPAVYDGPTGRIHYFVDEEGVAHFSNDPAEPRYAPLSGSRPGGRPDAQPFEWKYAASSSLAPIPSALPSPGKSTCGSSLVSGRCSG